jgi:hypothetical protein
MTSGEQDPPVLYTYPNVGIAQDIPALGPPDAPVGY